VKRTVTRVCGAFHAPYGNVPSHVPYLSQTEGSKP